MVSPTRGTRTDIPNLNAFSLVSFLFCWTFPLCTHPVRIPQPDHVAMHRFYTSCLALATATAVSGTPTPPLLDRAAASCTDASLKGFQWTVEDFDYHASYIFSTPAHQNSWGYVDFNLSNPAVPDVLESCSAASSQLEDFFYGTVVYQCALNATSTSAKTPPTFSFNRITGELDVNQTWTCYDKDPKYP